MNDTSNDHEVALAHKAVVERLWTEPLYEECHERLPRPESGTLLIAEARCGYVAFHIGSELPEQTRIIALDPSRTMLDQGRQRVEDEGEHQVFFVPQRVSDLSYADDVFQGTICLHGLVTARQAAEGVAELARVTEPGGRILVAAPLATSFPEFYDMLDEALRAKELTGVWPRVEELRESLISPARLVSIARDEGIHDLDVEEISWQVGFEGGRQFLHSPLIRETFFPQWIGTIRSSEREPILRYIADAIDTYWHDRAFQCEVVAGVLVGTR